jgi:hypothetical protein
MYRYPTVPCTDEDRRRKPAGGRWYIGAALDVPYLTT